MKARETKRDRREIERGRGRAREREIIYTLCQQMEITGERERERQLSAMGSTPWLKHQGILPIKYGGKYSKIEHL